MTSIEETISILKGLIVACLAVADGSTKPIATQEPKMQDAVRDKARQRRRMAGELEQVVVRLGGDPQFFALAGTNQLLWPAADSDAPADSHGQVGPREKALQELYRRALQAGLPLNIRMLVQRQYVEISALPVRVHQFKPAGGSSAGGGRGWSSMEGAMAKRNSRVYPRE